jgi:hypothetical protein
MAVEATRPDEPLPTSVRAALAPLHRSAFGAAVGCVTGGVVLLLTAFHVLAQPAGGLRLGLLGQFFPGYDVTWPGAAIGFVWASFAGFAGGWLVAFLHNTFAKLWVARVLRRAELAQMRDFLDQI